MKNPHRKNSIKFHVVYVEAQVKIHNVLHDNLTQISMQISTWNITWIHDILVKLWLIILDQIMKSQNRLKMKMIIDVNGK